jgi:hypothetical protein
LREEVEFKNEAQTYVVKLATKTRSIYTIQWFVEITSNLELFSLQSGYCGSFSQKIHRISPEHDSFNFQLTFVRSPGKSFLSLAKLAASQPLKDLVSPALSHEHEPLLTLKLSVMFICYASWKGKFCDVHEMRDYLSLCFAQATFSAHMSTTKQK